MYFRVLVIYIDRAGTGVRISRRLTLNRQIDAMEFLHPTVRATRRTAMYQLHGTIMHTNGSGSTKNG